VDRQKSCMTTLPPLSPRVPCARANLGGRVLPSGRHVDSALSPTSSTARAMATTLLARAGGCGSSNSSSSRRHPRLPVVAGTEPSAGVVSLQKFAADGRDWRCLIPSEVVLHLEHLASAASKQPDLCSPYTGCAPGMQASCRAYREGLLVAIAVGVMQAMRDGSYLAPHPEDPSAVLCADLRTPLSRIFLTSPRSPLGTVGENGAPAEVSVLGDVCPLEICLHLASQEVHPHIAIAHLTAVGGSLQRPEALFVGGDLRQTPLLLQTSYLWAMREMARQSHDDPEAAMDAGSLVYTTDVTILRAPVKQGAAWLRDPARVDVLWTALARSPPVNQHGDGYSRSEDKAEVTQRLVRMLRCAVAHGVEALVLPVPGGGCRHPAVGLGQVFNDVILRHGRGIRHILVCRHDGDLTGGFWESFVAGLRQERKQEAVGVPLRVHRTLQHGGGPFSQGWLRRIPQFVESEPGRTLLVRKGTSGTTPRRDLSVPLT